MTILLEVGGKLGRNGARQMVLGARHNGAQQCSLMCKQGVMEVICQDDGMGVFASVPKVAWHH
jgi:hypothetical protein